LKQQNEFLAEALSSAKAKSKNSVIKSDDLDRGVRERLMQAGYLEEVMRGWYLLTTPAGMGTTTLWFSSYWSFIGEYLTERFGGNYCLSAESSLELHSGQTTTPLQMQVLTRKPSNQVIELLHKTSLVLVLDKNFPDTVEKKSGLNVMPLSVAICRTQPGHFLTNPLSMEIALKLISSASELSRVLLAMGSTAAANRIAGAFEALGEKQKATQIKNDMTAAGFAIHPVNPFKPGEPLLKSIPRLSSPYVGRIIALWEKMRPGVIDSFPKHGDDLDKRSALKIIERLYEQDAYHSLSIEGYQVTEDMIARIKSGEWNPDNGKKDNEQKNAMAAKGYFNAFKSVGKSVNQVLNQKDAAKVLEHDLQTWYRELFTPSVQAKILKPEQLAGYRNCPVYIQKSFHVPPPESAVVDSMEVFFDLLKKEENTAVRAVLGHFIFVYIHPYVDGNGRIGRFILNLMLASGGYHWTIIRVSERVRYMASLEEATVNGNIVPFTKFIAGEMKFWNKEVNKILKEKNY